MKLSMNKAVGYGAICMLLTVSATADESTFLCKRIDDGVSLIFSATTVVSKDLQGNYGEPLDVAFAHTPKGEGRVWTTLDGSTRFILMKGQIYVMDAQGKVHGKIVCE